MRWSSAPLLLIPHRKADEVALIAAGQIAFHLTAILVGGGKPVLSSVFSFGTSVSRPLPIGERMLSDLLKQQALYESNVKKLRDAQHSSSAGAGSQCGRGRGGRGGRGRGNGGAGKGKAGAQGRGKAADKAQDEQE